MSTRSEQEQQGDTMMTEEQAAELLRAGAVLPPGTRGAGERAVPLTTRGYRHPGLDGRVVVRLVPGELGAAEDLVAGFLGLEPDGEPVTVGLGLRQALGFPEWVLAHHPADGHHALAVVPELERIARQATAKPKNALEAYQALGERLAAAVPHFLPTFYEQAARVFLGVENASYAAQLFARARKAEAQHGLAVDEQRLDAVFLEFALAGALPVKVLSGYAKELSTRVPAAEAFDRFRRLCVRRTAGGLEPSAVMATDLRRLARAAGADPLTAEGDYLAELLDLPATLRAGAGWWQRHREALVDLARREEAVRGRLLDLMPTTGDEAAPALWLAVLTEAGATAGLHDDALPAAQRPADGTAGWFTRFLTWRGTRHWRGQPRIAALYPLVEHLAERLRSEHTAAGSAVPVPESDVDLLDQLLALGVPVADPGEHAALHLDGWAQHHQQPGRSADQRATHQATPQADQRPDPQRDLLALAADPRFHTAFRLGADRLGNNDSGRHAFAVLIDSPGGRPLLAAWMAAVARASGAAGLPELSNAYQRLSWLPGEVLALAEEEVRAVAGTDLSGLLARALRAGLLDELGWPAWDRAAAELVAPKDIEQIVVADAWPHLIAAGAGQARVLDAEGTVLSHDLRIPAGDPTEHGFHYVDGSLLVQWRSRANSSRHLGYWHTKADQVFTMPEATSCRGKRTYWLGALNSHGLPLPSGGRTGGHGVVHAGDTALPAEREVIGDGRGYWVRLLVEGAERPEWHDYDPATDTVGRPCAPAFLADALRTAPAGSVLEDGWVRPAPDPLPATAGEPVGGVLGWRLLHLPDGSHRGEDQAGRSVTVPARRGKPLHLLEFPGAARPQAVVWDGSYSIRLVDQDGVTTATARTDNTPGTFAEGTPILPPLRYWHYLRPRDPQGSAALRGLTEETAAALLKAAAAVHPDHPEQLTAAVAALLPQVTDPALLAGIAGVIRFATGPQQQLDAVVERLERVLAGTEEPAAEVPGPGDEELGWALCGLGAVERWWGSGQQTRHAAEQLWFLARAAHPDTAAAAPGTVHLDAVEAPVRRLDWTAVPELADAVALRAVAATSTPVDRVALRGLFEALARIGLTTAAGTARWRTVRLRLPAAHTPARTGNRRQRNEHRLLALGDGAFLLFVGDTAQDDGGLVSSALFHDPAERFTVPAPYTLLGSTAPQRTLPDDRAAALLACAAEREPAPWFPAAAARFADLTGVTATMATLLLAGLPRIEDWQRNFLPAETRALLGLKVADAAAAREELRRLDTTTCRRFFAALVPADPARLWDEGPDVEAAALLWNELVGRRVAVPEDLLTEANKTLRTDWPTRQALEAVLAPGSSAVLTEDLAWRIKADRAAPVDDKRTGFTAATLVAAITTAGWLAHRLPAGHPLRAALPAALAAVRARLANPELLLDLNRYVSLSGFRKIAGTPTETGEGYERYGAVLLATHDDQPAPALRTALLDAAGEDPYLPVLRADAEPFPAETALKAARSAAFEALLADPGDPVAGERGPDGTWWPQDPSRSVPELVGAVAERHGLGADAAALYLMLLAMPDPTDRTTARWTGWRPARLKAARAELAATDLVVQATRSRAGRTLFLPGGWTEERSPRLPLETWKLPLLRGDGLPGGGLPGAQVPVEPAAALYRRAWQRLLDGDLPRFEELKAPKARRGRRR
ncbi:DNA-binding protein [Kitasatospora sp. LaBMicrA B282]|uniref:DNA-binding protein n=1 Tax=Kitasatospora sp. LaBMicrA B282 TaxID=3420949 RepID=UPI003D135D74